MSGLFEIIVGNAIMATLLAVVALGLCRVCRRPAFVHGVWLVVLLKLVTPPLFEIPLPWLDAPEPAQAEPELGLKVTWSEPDPTPLADEQPAEFSSAGTEAPAQVFEKANLGTAPPTTPILPSSWRLPLLLAWLTGSALVLFGSIRSIVRFRRLLRFARPADQPMQDMVRDLAARLKLVKHPQVWLIAGKISPMLWALGTRPRLIFPAELLNRLDSEQLRTVLLHELVHWRRRDHWVRLLELAVTVVYWWHPAVWWARARLRDAEEHCCDAWVVRVLQGADKTYALALLETVAFFSKARVPLPVSASGIGQVPQLRRRLTMIMSGNQRGSLGWLGSIGLAAFGLLLLPLLTVRAQQPEKKPAQAFFEKDGLRIVLDDSSDNQEAIELLKRALQLLAEKKKAETKPEAKRGTPEEIKNAREHVEKLTKQAADEHKALAATETRLQEARTRLAALQGESGPLPLQFKSTIYRFETMPKLEWRVVPQQALEIKPNITKQLELSFQRAGKGEHTANPEEMKKRLEDLQRQVEDLRRQLERARSSDKHLDPLGPPKSKS